MGRNLKLKICNFVEEVLYSKVWLGASASVQGRSHLQAGVPCQDSTCTEHYKGCIVVAVADGAGSKQYSHLASRQLVKTICSLLKTDFNSLFYQHKYDIKKNVYSHLMNAIINESNKNHIPISELSSTLLVIAIKDDRMLAFHIGDGCIGFLSSSGSVELFSEPFNGEYPNSTIFFTSLTGFDEFRCYKGRVGEIEGFILMSDGSADSLYHKTDKSFAPACIKMINMLSNPELATEELLLTSLNLIRTRTTDDCSLALLKKIGKKKKEFEVINENIMKVISKTNDRLIWEKYYCLWEQIYDHQVFNIKQLSRLLPYKKREIRKILHMTQQYVKGTSNNFDF